MAVTDLPGLIPVSVTCAFPKTVDGVWSGESYVKTTTLASLALAEFTGALTNPNTHVLRHSAVAAYVGMAGTPSNQTELDAMAAQMAADWYRWQLGKANVAFNGTVDFAPCGLIDAIEWDWDQPRPRTAVYRAAFNDLASKRLTSGAAGGIVNFYFSLYVVNAFITNLWVTETVNWTNVYVTFVNVTYDVDNSFLFSYYGDTVYIGHFVTNVCPSVGAGDGGTGTSTAINSGTWTDLTDSEGTVEGPAGEQPALVTGTAYCTGDYSDVFELRLAINGVGLSASTFAPSGAAVSLEVPLRPGAPLIQPGNNTVKIQARRTVGSGTMTVTSAVWAIMSGTSITVEHPGPVCVIDPDTCCTTGPENPRDPPDEPPVTTECCEGVAIPRTLYATPSGQTGTCGCVGDVVTLEYNAVSEKWEGTGLDCDVSFTVTFYCHDDPSWSLEIDGPDGETGFSSVPDSCDPFSCVFTANFVLVDDGICTGNVVWTITETP